MSTDLNEHTFASKQLNQNQIIKRKPNTIFIKKEGRTQGGGRVSWDEVREWHGLIFTLPNVKQIASGKQLHSTGRSARCFVTT